MSEIIQQAMGKLAAQMGYVNHPLRVLQSREGWYIGTINAFTGPISRESKEYFPTRLDAEEALADGSWTQKEQP